MLTQEELKRRFSYDPATGNLLFLVRTSNRINIGDVAGTINKKGYRVIGCDGTKYYAHRLVWLFHKGVYPEFDTDHFNRNRSDNRIENLRDIPHVGNMSNTENTNETGFKGVCRNKKKFNAALQCEGKKVHLGSFDTPEQASEAFVRAHVDRYGVDSEFYKEAA